MNSMRPTPGNTIKHETLKTGSILEAAASKGTSYKNMRSFDSSHFAGK